MTYEELRPLLKWRAGKFRGWTPELLEGSLSVESLPYDRIPERHYRQVVGFRKRRKDGRRALCRRYLQEVRKA